MLQKIKQKSSALLVALLLLTLTKGYGLTPVAMAATFPDVPDNTVHFHAIEYLKNKGVVSGYPDGTFQPGKTINRAEALKMVMLATATALDSETTLDFPDVAEDAWFYDHVRKAFDLKIAEGYPDGNFKPENNINIAESLKIILRSFAVTLPETVTKDVYPDVSKDVWYASYAEYSRVKQLIWAMDDGNLSAGRDITRGDFAEIIYRLMYIRELNLATFPLSTDWPTFTHPSDHYSLKYPFSWLKIEAGKQTVFWKQDSANHQLSFARVFPNGATVVMAVDVNEDRLGLSEYLARLNYGQSAETEQKTLNGYPFQTVTVAGTGTVDYYFEFPNKSIVAVYTQMGDGLNQTQLAEEIRYMVGSIRYNEGTVAVTSTPRDEFLSNVRKNILVKGTGQEALSLFQDLLVIETDTIGIGTGPVDYYFSNEYDVTLKYERDSLTVLAMSDGRNTAF